VPIGPLTVMAGSDPPAGTGAGFVHVAEGISQFQPLPDTDVVENGSGMFTVTRPELADVPTLLTEIEYVPLPPATKGELVGAKLRVRSTGTLAVTGVEIDAVLLVVLPSLAFDTEADRSSVP
jgi:hypothetical protein